MDGERTTINITRKTRRRLWNFQCRRKLRSSDEAIRFALRKLAEYEAKERSHVCAK